MVQIQSDQISFSMAATTSASIEQVPKNNQHKKG
jgi:hypothetical protein